MRNTNNKKTVLAILKQARSLIRKGWVQNAFYSDDEGKECYCSLGAISKAVHDSPETPWCSKWETNPEKLKTVKLFNRAVDKLTQNHTIRKSWCGFNEKIDILDQECAVAEWNDKGTTTKKDVLNAFDQAIIGLQKDKK